MQIEIVDSHDFTGCLGCAWEDRKVNHHASTAKTPLEALSIVPSAHLVLEMDNLRQLKIEGRGEDN